MGCFDTKCIVSQTPIVYGETCHVLVFRKKTIKKWGGRDAAGLQFLFGDGFVGYLKGKYDDYGGVDKEIFTLLTVEDHSFDYFKGNYINFFVSDDAWNFISKLVENKDEYLENFIESWIELYEIKTKENREVVKNLRSFIFATHGKYYRYVYHIYNFCLANNFDPFIDYFYNFYAGQSFQLKEKKQFQKLRGDRISKLEKIELY